MALREEEFLREAMMAGVSSENPGPSSSSPTRVGDNNDDDDYDQTEAMSIDGTVNADDDDDRTMYTHSSVGSGGNLMDLDADVNVNLNVRNSHTADNHIDHNHQGQTANTPHEEENSFLSPSSSPLSSLSSISTPSSSSAAVFHPDYSSQNQQQIDGRSFPGLARHLDNRMEEGFQSNHPSSSQTSSYPSPLLRDYPLYGTYFGPSTNPFASVDWGHRHELVRQFPTSALRSTLRREEQHGKQEQQEEEAGEIGQSKGKAPETTSVAGERAAASNYFPNRVSQHCYVQDYLNHHHHHHHHKPHDNGGQEEDHQNGQN